jgi:hypothetical protein
VHDHDRRIVLNGGQLVDRDDLVVGDAVDFELGQSVLVEILDVTFAARKIDRAVAGAEPVQALHFASELVDRLDILFAVIKADDGAVVVVDVLDHAGQLTIVDDPVTDTDRRTVSADCALKIRPGFACASAQVERRSEEHERECPQMRTPLYHLNSSPCEDFPVVSLKRLRLLLTALERL